MITPKACMLLSHWQRPEEPMLPGNPLGFPAGYAPRRGVLQAAWFGLSPPLCNHTVLPPSAGWPWGPQAYLAVLVDLHPEAAQAPSYGARGIVSIHQVELQRACSHGRNWTWPIGLFLI